MTLDGLHPRQFLDLHLLLQIQEQQRAASPEGAVDGRIETAQRGVRNAGRAQGRRELRQHLGQHFARGNDAALDERLDRIAHAALKLANNG